jgi:hypothetical protein
VGRGAVVLDKPPTWRDDQLRLWLQWAQPVDNFTPRSTGFALFFLAVGADWV